MISAAGLFGASWGTDSRGVPARGRIAWPVFLVAIALIAVVTSSCGGPPAAAPVETATEEPVAPVVADRAEPNGATAVVRRGLLVQTLVLDGRVTGPDDVDVAMPQPARVHRILASPGQQVRAGAPLLEIEAPASDDPPVDARSADDAEAQAERLRRVIEQLDRVRGNGGLDRLAAADAVLLARANLQRLEAERARLSAGPEPAERRLAEQDVEAATAVLRRAEAEQERALRGPDAAAIRRAESEVAAVETDLGRAQTAYRQLVRGPDPAEVRAAEREVEQAEAMLQMAQGIKLVPLPTPTARPRGNGNREVRAERDARARVAQDASNQQLQQTLAVRQAEQVLESSRDRLARLQRGPSRPDVEAAARDVESASQKVDDARERLAALRRGPDRSTTEAAAVAVATARSGLALAEKRLADLGAGPPAEDLAAATAAVDGARLAVQAAEARLTDLVAADAARRELEPDGSARDEAVTAALAGPSGPALGAALSAPDRATAGVVEGSPRSAPPLGGPPPTAQVGAPVDGSIVALHVTAGDAVPAGRRIVTLSTADERIVRAPLRTGRIGRIASGSPVSVQVSSGAAPLTGAVAAVDDGSEPAQLLVTVGWGADHPSPGSSVQATVMLASRSDTLIVPLAAVREEQGVRYVEAVEGTTVRRVDVTTGLETDVEIEILAGLREGQVVRLSR